MAELYEQLHGVPDQQWCEMVVRSLDERPVDRFELPDFPTATVQRVATDVADRGMLERAFELYAIIKHECASLGRPITSTTKVLDFGCGWGRIARFFLKDLPTANLFGVDAVSELVEACRQTISPLQFQTVTQRGRLPFEDRSFDVVFANSVFSHLNEDLHRAWMQEITRVLQPRGIVIVTIVDEQILRRWHRTDNAFARWAVGIVGDLEQAYFRVEQGEFLWYSTRRSGPLLGYGLAFMSTQWAHRNWPKELSVHRVRHDYTQAVVVANNAGQTASD